MCVCVWIAVKFYTVGFFEKEMQSLYMSVCAFVRPHSMQHLQTQKPSLQWRLMSTHPNVNFFSSTVISQLVFTIHSFFLFHWSIYLLSPCRLDSLVSPFPPFSVSHPLPLANKQCWLSSWLAVGARHLNLLLYHAPSLFSPPFSSSSPSLSTFLFLWAL